MSSPAKEAGLAPPNGSGSGRDGRPSEMERTLSAGQLAGLRADFEQRYGTSPVVPNIPPRSTSHSQSQSQSQAVSETHTPVRGLSPRPSSSNLLGTSPNAAAGPSGFARGTSPGPGSSSLEPGAAGLSIEDLSDEQKARIIRKHFVGREGQAKSRRESQGQDKSPEGLRGKLRAMLSGKKTTPAPQPDGFEDVEARANSEGLTTDEFPMPFGMQGGDVTHDLYKWQRNALANSPNNPKKLKRSKSTGELSQTSAIHLAEEPDEEEDPLTSDIRKMREPGGFRRNYINRKLSNAAPSGSNGAVRRPRPARATGSFVDFLSLYGHLAGEELEEIDEEDEDELEEEALEAAEEGIPEGTPASRNVDERTPLLKRQDTRARIARKRVAEQGKKGEATVLQAVLMLLKSFVGTGILFLGRAFYNGGMLFSTVVLLSIAMISLYSFLLLVKTRLVVPGSFGDMGGVLYGPWLRIAILTSITFSQIGFVAAYTIFVAENLQAFTMAVSNCRVYVPIAVMIAAQMIFYMPLAMFRNIHKLSGTALIADAFILIGIIYIVRLEVGHLKEFGLGDIQLFNQKNFPLLIGTAVFSFEGVGLVIPITEAMKEPEKFPRVLSGVMIFVALLFGSAGALAYATFGKDIQTVVLVNLPQEDRFVNAVQFLYSIAIMLSTPLQLFPAVRIMEQGIFSRSGKYSTKVKWEKNVFRAAVVLGCSLISWAGARDLDKFVAFIGSAACVPLCFCYPPMLHYKACAKKWYVRVADIALIIFGVVMMVFTSVQTIHMLLENQQSSPPKFGKCPTPA